MMINPTTPKMSTAGRRIVLAMCHYAKPVFRTDNRQLSVRPGLEHLLAAADRSWAEQRAVARTNFSKPPSACSSRTSAWTRPSAKELMRASLETAAPFTRDGYRLLSEGSRRIEQLGTAAIDLDFVDVQYGIRMMLTTDTLGANIFAFATSPNRPRSARGSV